MTPCSGQVLAAGSLDQEGHPHDEMASVRFLRGAWLITRIGDRAQAQNLTTRSELAFTGELTADLLADGRCIQKLAQADPSYLDLAEALKQPARAPTVGDILRGSGFRVLFLELTGQCNERCAHCYASSAPEVSKALSQEQIGSLILQANNLGIPTLQLTGGDPLISPHIEFAIREASALSFRRVEVYTNGLAFNETLAALFAAHGVSMAISLYSDMPDVHDAVTKTTGSHERTTRAIRLALRHGIRVRVGGVQGINNKQDETALRDYIRALGVPSDRIAMDVQRPVGRGEWNEQAALLPLEQRAHYSPEEREGGRLCVTYSGNIVPCIFDRDTVLGHIEHISLRDALSQEVLPRAPQKRLKTIGTPLSCPQCRFRHQLLHPTGA